MSKGDFWDWLRGIIIIVLVVALIAGVVGGIFHAIDISVEKDCKRLGDQIGYNTKRVSGGCQIEIRPNVWVAKYNVASILPLIDCK